MLQSGGIEVKHSSMWGGWHSNEVSGPFQAWSMEKH